MPGSDQICFAVDKGDVAILKQLWDADVANSTCATSSGLRAGYYAIHLAVVHDHLHILKYMLENGADPNVRTQIGGNTPIRAAAQWTHCPKFAMIQLLLEHGANPYTQNKDEDSAFTDRWGGEQGHGVCYMESYLVVELVTGEADSLPLDMWRVVKSFLYKL